MKKKLVIALSITICLLLIILSASCTKTTDTKVAEQVVETEPGQETELKEEEGDASQDELKKDALDIAIAWFVGPETDYTADQFDWKVESFVEDNEGTWWARISATPKDPSMNTEQIYVNKLAGMSLFYPIGREPDVSPLTDDQFPEEVRDKL